MLLTLKHSTKRYYCILLFVLTELLELFILIFYHSFMIRRTSICSVKTNGSMKIRLAECFSVNSVMYDAQLKKCSEIC